MSSRTIGSRAWVLDEQVSPSRLTSTPINDRIELNHLTVLSGGVYPLSLPPFFPSLSFSLEVKCQSNENAPVAMTWLLVYFLCDAETRKRKRRDNSHRREDCRTVRIKRSTFRAGRGLLRPGWAWQPRHIMTGEVSNSRCEEKIYRRDI